MLCAVLGGYARCSAGEADQCCMPQVVSFFEWVQNLQNFRWEEEEVNRRLDRHMTDAFVAIHKARRERRVTYRKAAYTVALQEVMRAHQNRGFD